MKKAAIFLYVTLNGTWTFIAYSLHKSGIPLGAIAFVMGIGVVFGNLALYAGIRGVAKIGTKRRNQGAN